MTTTGTRGRIPGRLRDDRGQLIVEFTGMLPILLVTLVLLWEAVLVGYTFVLAAGAADEGVRRAVGAGTRGDGGACREAVLERLPSAWEGSARIDCGSPGSGDVVRVGVTLRAPVLFPGFVGLPIPVTATAGAPVEGR
ncbi:pilus assembly protein [Streptomyces sp. NBC_01754]|uniref:TadE/TadG family type IV pilus assembly protein n=1 Tax=Streptomyces sp. NBC_01754 TaxID=2975930 RepID=UPI002DD9B9EA|nr:TadE family protein [Streptomyces sp. NBC_01754]WSC94553.1 pilus assembly protein [Streptomyces sp. NBC_01754]